MGRCVRVKVLEHLGLQTTAYFSAALCLVKRAVGGEVEEEECVCVFVCVCVAGIGCSLVGWEFGWSGEV